MNSCEFGEKFSCLIIEMIIKIPTNIKVSKNKFHSDNSVRYVWALCITLVTSVETPFI